MYYLLSDKMKVEIDNEYIKKLIFYIVYIF